MFACLWLVSTGMSFVMRSCPASLTKVASLSLHKPPQGVWAQHLGSVTPTANSLRSSDEWSTMLYGWKSVLWTITFEFMLRLRCDVSPLESQLCFVVCLSGVPVCCRSPPMSVQGRFAVYMSCTFRRTVGIHTVTVVSQSLFKQMGGAMPALQSIQQIWVYVNCHLDDIVNMDIFCDSPDKKRSFWACNFRCGYLFFYIFFVVPRFAQVVGEHVCDSLGQVSSVSFWQWLSSLQGLAVQASHRRWIFHQVWTATDFSQPCTAQNKGPYQTSEIKPPWIRVSVSAIRYICMFMMQMLTRRCANVEHPLSAETSIDDAGILILRRQCVRNSRCLGWCDFLYSDRQPNDLAQDRIVHRQQVGLGVRIVQSGNEGWRNPHPD